jgi:LysM repeat protein
MKTSLRHLFWISVLLCSDVTGQQEAAAAYTIKPGDSLARIARRHGCTADELARANGLKLSSVIHPGQTLKIPGSAGAPGPKTVPSSSGTHTIETGDTLSAISRRYGIPVASLLAANPGINPKTLKVGQKIQLGTAAKPDATPPRPTPATPAVEKDPAAGATGESTDLPAEESAPSEAEAKIITVMVKEEVTYGEFAAKHGTDIARLNDLNGLDLTSATVLAKGSELYVPSQP